MIIEQFLPAFHYGDAVGNSTLRFHEYLIEQGVESKIVSLTIDEQLREKAEMFRDYQENPNSLKILHHAVPSILTDFFLKINGKKVMIYHNITPERFFVDYSRQLTRFTRLGREHLKSLSSCFDLALADSQYNEIELNQLGFNNVVPFPIMINLNDYRKPHSQPFYDLLRDDRKNIIFVGRVTPNKKIEDLVKIVFYYKKYISASIRLIIAGNTNTLPKYYLAVRDLAARFYLTHEDLYFTGHIPFSELLSVYRLADLFISMSEHEGFCLPLIESCFFSVPALAYNAGAVSETLKGAGFLIDRKNTQESAFFGHEIMTNQSIRDRLKSLQQERISVYEKESDPKILLKLLQAL